ncbi:uncharacterized protein [Diadema setosum]|uniref:uncharacterized protein n=1 Tax=Diadema setosum TaxID=31175 RepID=UPI003B3B2E93
MASLVADYASSSDSESDENDQHDGDLKAQNERDVKHGKQTNLLTSHDGSSSSDSESADVNQKFQSEPERNARHSLPLPEVFGASQSVTEGKNLPSLSVFANPYEQERQKQLSILEKHVKLKEEEKMDSHRPRNVCYKFQKFQNCKFGDKCRYLHIGGNQGPLPAGGSQEPSPGTSRLPANTSASDRDSVHSHQVQSVQGHRQKFVCHLFQNFGKCRYGNSCRFSHAIGTDQSAMHGAPSSAGYVRSPHENRFYQGDGERRGEEEEEDTVQRKRKDRAGLGDSLVLSKKAKRIYDRQRQQDRPWTDRT